MNRKIKISSYFLAFVILSILTSCHHHEIDGDNVYYIYWNEGSGKNKILIQGADAKTFRELEHTKYSIDQNHVYYEAEKLIDADPKTFVSLLNYYGKDARFAYKGAGKIDGADGNTFEVIDGGPYSKDYRDYYLDTIALKVSDLKTFTILDPNSDYGYWAKDKSFYYWSVKKCPLRDYESFLKIGNGYAKDKFQVYFQDSIVTYADPLTFRTQEFPYGQDKNNRYDGVKKLNIKDPDSFESLQFGFTKDKFNVYNNGNIVEDADPATFEFITGSMWAKDKKSYFFQGKAIPFIDYNSFRYLDYHYAIDKNNVYYDDQIIKGADSKTFIHIEGSQDGKDKNGCYRYGEKTDCKNIDEDNN